MLLEFRAGIRRFLRWSEDAARDAGLSPVAHQLLLAVRGCGISGGPRISDIAQYLVVRHHTAVELIDRAERAGLVVRKRDPQDSRAVRVHLTENGLAHLEALTEQHIQELRRVSPTFAKIWRGLEGR